MSTQATQAPTLDNVMRELTEVRRDLRKARKRSFATPIALGASWFVQGVTLTFTAVYLSTFYWWGLGLMVIGILSVAYFWFKSSRIKVELEQTPRKTAVSGRAE